MGRVAGSASGPPATRGIRLFEGECRLGATGSSNAVVARARASIVARMDADDISHRERLARQWRVLATRPEVVLVGALCDGIDARGRVVRPRDRWRIVRLSNHLPFPHGSVMFRKSAFEAVGGYRAECDGFEDQDLCLRLRAVGAIVTLPEVLYHYRYHATNSSALEPRPSSRSDATEALHVAGAMRLWADAAPAPAPFWREHVRVATRKPWRPMALAALAYASWGALHPASLRGALRGFIRVRDLLAATHVKDGRTYPWRSA